jgi:hypothetical protein
VVAHCRWADTLGASTADAVTVPLALSGGTRKRKHADQETHRGSTSSSAAVASDDHENSASAEEGDQTDTAGASQGTAPPAGAGRVVPGGGPTLHSGSRSSIPVPVSKKRVRGAVQFSSETGKKARK